MMSVRAVKNTPEEAPHTEIQLLIAFSAQIPKEPGDFYLEYPFE